MVPDCLNQEAEILSALSEAERLKGNLLSASRKVKDCSFSVQLKYLDEQINDLSLQLDRKRNETAKIYKLLRKTNNSAFVITNLHFSCGIPWEEIAEILGFDATETVKSRAYRALERLQKAGLI